jgi:hypothetical protein
MKYYFLREKAINREKGFMEYQNMDHFNERIRVRTKSFSIEVYKVLNTIKLGDLNRIPVRQNLFKRKPTIFSASFHQ